MRQPVIHALLALLALLSACHPSETTGGGSDRDERASAASPRPEEIPIVVFEPPGKPRAAVTVELARTPEQIQRGLMFRRSMPPDHGMLFLMKQERIHSFWMRNTYIPLDMIFIARDMTVAGVVANTVPLTEDSRRVDRPSYYVLEVNADWAATHHVQPGTRVRFKNVAE